MQIAISSGQNETQQVQESFFFEPIPNKTFQQKQFQQVLTKWGLGETLKIGTFRFNQHFQSYDVQRFIKDLFNNPNVRYLLSNLNYPVSTIGSVEAQKLDCSHLTLQIFDEFEKQGLVKGDFIQKCMSEYYEGIQICDKIRECLLLEQSESYSILNEQQRKQLLIKLFQLLLVGGSLNQYEDKITPYLEWTKKIYKALVSVRKKPETSQIFVESLAFTIKSFDNGKVKIQKHNPQTFAYVVINPSIRTVNILANQWVKFW